MARAAKESLLMPATSAALRALLGMSVLPPGVPWPADALVSPFRDGSSGRPGRGGRPFCRGGAGVSVVPAPRPGALSVSPKVCRSTDESGPDVTAPENAVLAELAPPLSFFAPGESAPDAPAAAAAPVAAAVLVEAVPRAPRGFS